MNKDWVDKHIEFLSLKLWVFKPNPGEFYFEPTEEIYRKLGSGDEHDLQCVATEIAKHLGIASIPMAKYDWTLKMELEVAGQIKLTSLVHYIQIPFSYVGKKYAVGAILAHEMTHAFLSEKGISLNTPNESEMFTDLATVFIGLGKFLLNGVIVRTDEYLGGHQLGYLSPEWLAYCYQRVYTYRSISIEIAMKNLIPEAKNRVNNLQINPDENVT